MEQTGMTISELGDVLGYRSRALPSFAKATAGEKS